MQYIKKACDENAGWIRFSAFMNIALYQPALGYYSGGLQKFGASGDFITAPEVSHLFAQCLANQAAEIIRNMQARPGLPGQSVKPVQLIEFGAGSGILAADLLLRLQHLDALPENYFIIELSAELKQRQKQTLVEKAPELLGRVQWLDKLPTDINNAVVVANEVLDAMPVEGFSVTDHGIESLMVGFGDGSLVSRYMPADKHTEAVVNDMQQRSEMIIAEPYRSEFNPALAGWIAGLADSAEHLVVLLVDYGYNELEYYHPDRSSGTLMCYYQHRAHDDFLRWPGLQDITAFVNFTDVAYAAVASGMEVSGYTTQAAFLLANGLSELHAEQLTDDLQQQVQLSQQIKTLTLPSEMGDKFKVMALAKNYEQPLTGFSMLDLRNRL